MSIVTGICLGGHCDVRRDYWLVRIVRINIYVKVILSLLVPAPLQFGARDLGFSYLGSGVRTDKPVVWIDQEFAYEPTTQTFWMQPEMIGRMQPYIRRLSPENRVHPVCVDRYKDGPGHCWYKCCYTSPRAVSSIRPPEWCQTKTVQHICRLI